MLEIIDSRVRDQCVESDILALGTPAALLLQQGYKEIVISGGPNSVYAADASLNDQQSLLAVFQCRCNGGEKICLRWAIRDPSRNGVPNV
ncbi:hypothetical protein OUZ56_002700 [Daphnia magna]|uniref:Uncharacterized protein n=1 Tax=Daphnia magna TaxID=35525 RepID=A0ABR0A6H8_9CRUS|nr:hypothetical protein OUZ56_002700 [Daphnia magna]